MKQRFLLFKPTILTYCSYLQWYLPQFLCCCLKGKKLKRELFLNNLTLRNVHFSDDCALIASYSAQVYCLYNISLYRVSPSTMSRLLCVTHVFIWDAFPLAVSTVWRRWERKYLSLTSCHNVLCFPMPPCHSSLLLFTVLTAIPLGTSFVSISWWITGAMQKTIWHDVVLKWASLCDAVLLCLL